jgi:hypothetical protein
MTAVPPNAAGGPAPGRDEGHLAHGAAVAPRSRWAGVVTWGLTLAALLAALWFATSLLNRCTPATIAEGAGRGIGQGLAAAAGNLRDLLKPSVTVSPLVVLRGEDRTPKLVVYTHMADVIAPIEETVPYWGSTYSSATARGCRAQFIIPLDRMTDRDLMLAPGGEGEPARIVVLAPRPRVDTDMLAISPESIEFEERNSGMRTITRMFAGPDKERLTKLLRPALLEAVSRPDVRARAEQSAREYFENQFAQMLRSELRMGRDVVVDVRWVDD